LFQAEQRLCGTFSADKNEILFSEFGINYNNELELYRKGTVMVRAKQKKESEDPEGIMRVNRQIIALNTDIIQDSFWQKYPVLQDS
jgi:tRNA(His) guanylyltransferase